MPQSRIHDHFAPSNKYPRSRPTQSHVQRPPPRRWSSDSEGSEGLEAIHLSAKKTKDAKKKEAPPAKVQMSQKRATKRAVVDSDDEEEEEEEEEPRAGPSSRRRRAETPPSRPSRKGSGSGRKVVDPDGSESEPDSLAGYTAKGKGKAKRASSPARSITPTPTSRSKRGTKARQADEADDADFVIEVPSLSPKQRARYSSYDGLPSRSDRPSSSRKKEVIEVVSSDDDDDIDDHTPITRRLLASRSKSKSSPLAPKRVTRSTISPTVQKRGPPSKSRSSPAQPKRTQKRVPTPVSESDSPSPVAKRTPKSAKRVKRDPDDSDGPSTDGEDMVAELELDQPDRFKSETRLRPRGETEFQRAIRKNKNRRLGIEESDTEDEDEDEEDEEEVQEEPTIGVKDDTVTEDDFISDDGEEVADNLLPHEFSMNSAQTPEFKFKVVFHYLLYLVMKGSDVLPLRGEAAEYFEPHLRDVRRRMTGFRDGGVRSQIWSAEFVRTLQKYPRFTIGNTGDMPIWWCDACRRRLPSHLFVWVGGIPYNHDTHEEIDDSAESSSESESDSKAVKARRAKRKKEARRLSKKTGVIRRKAKPDIQFTMGNHCTERSRVYHQMSHWEDDMYDRIQGIYHDLLRAARVRVADDSDTSSEDDSDEDHIDRISRRMRREDQRARAQTRAAELRQHKLPDDVEDVDEVLVWMDENKIQSKMFHLIEELVETARALEHDTSRDK